MKVSFGNEGGDKSVYINKEAHVSELAIRTANGRIYVLDDVLSPAVETIYDVFQTRVIIRYSVKRWRKQHGAIR